MEDRLKEAVKQTLLENYHEYLKTRPRLFTGDEREKYLIRVHCSEMESDLLTVAFDPKLFGYDYDRFIAAFLIEQADLGFDLSEDYRLKEIDKNEALWTVTSFMDNITATKVCSYLKDDILSVMSNGNQCNIFGRSKTRFVYIRGRTS